MPLNENKREPLKFTKKIGGVVKALVENSINYMPDLILILLIVSNFFVELRLILVLFIVFYFADRWSVFKLLIDKNYAVKVQDANVHNDPPHSS